MSNIELLEDWSSPIDGLDGYWCSEDVYLLSTPEGYVTLFYSADRAMMRFISDGHRWQRIYSNVKSKRHAVTLAKRFYRNLMK